MHLRERATALALMAAQGDREALADFIRLTQGDVWRFLASLHGRNSADDLTQETYLRALGALPSFQGRSSVMTWLFTIARRAAVDAQRGQPVTHETLPSAEGRDERVLAVSDEPVSDIHLALESLPAARREALVLTQIYGLSYAEAADVLDCAIGTVRSRVSRARSDLMDLLDRPPPAPDSSHHRNPTDQSDGAGNFRASASDYSLCARSCSCPATPQPSPWESC